MSDILILADASLHGDSLGGNLGLADAPLRGASLSDTLLPAAGRRFAARRLAERYIAAGRRLACLFGQTINLLMAVICHVLSWLHVVGG
jgi:hypothetical protein